MRGAICLFLHRMNEFPCINVPNLYLTLRLIFHCDQKRNLYLLFLELSLPLLLVLFPSLSLLILFFLPLRWAHCQALIYLIFLRTRIHPHPSFFLEIRVVFLFTGGMIIVIRGGEYVFLV